MKLLIEDCYTQGVAFALPTLMLFFKILELGYKGLIHSVNDPIEFSLNVSTEFVECSDKIFIITVKGFEPATQLPLV